MIIGLVKEIKTDEYRVGLTPACCREYHKHGHKVLIERGAGLGSGFPDREYRTVGCRVADKKTVFAKADMIVKVKEPLPSEYEMLRPGQILYTYLHLAADKKLTKAMLRRKIRGVAYETVTEADGSLPLLKPMSEIAGRISIQEGAKYLEKPFGGRGILLGGVPGIPRGKITIIGGGVVGTNACKMAVGIGAEVTILDLSSDRLAYLDDIFGSSITTLYSTDSNIEESISRADLVIGAVLIPGGAAPKLIRKEHLKMMKPGSVIVDVAVDQGGCCQTTKPTSHRDPIFLVNGVVHYCVANMPGVVALSSTTSLTSVTLRYGIMIANRGIEKAVQESPAIRTGTNVWDGKLTNRAVADALGMEYQPIG